VSRQLRLNALSLQLGAIASVLNAFALRRVGAVDAAAWGALAVVVTATLTSGLRGRGWPLRNDPLFLAIGLLDALGSLCLFASLARLGPVPVALLGGLAPVFAAPLAFLVLGERLTARQLLLGAASVGGALLFSWREGAPVSGAGLLLAGASTLAYAGGNLLAKLAMRRHPTCAVVVSSRLVALLAVLGYGLASGQLGSIPCDAAGVTLVVLAALLRSFLALLLFYEALREASLSVTTVVRSAGPVASAAAAWPFFPVTLSAVNVVGGAVLLGAVAWLGLSGSGARPGAAARAEPAAAR
jgi:drug/metabolite transporter (DMT)-like permease